MKFSNLLRRFREFRDLESKLAAVEVLKSRYRDDYHRLYKLFDATRDAHERCVDGLTESLRVMAASVPEKAAAMSAAEVNQLRDDNEAYRTTIARQGEWLRDRDRLIKHLKCELAAKPAKASRKKSK